MSLGGSRWTFFFALALLCAGFVIVAKLMVSKLRDYNVDDDSLSILDQGTFTNKEFSTDFVFKSMQQIIEELPEGGTGASTVDALIYIMLRQGDEKKLWVLNLKSSPPYVHLSQTTAFRVRNIGLSNAVLRERKSGRRHLRKPLPALPKRPNDAYAVGKDVGKADWGSWQMAVEAAKLCLSLASSENADLYFESFQTSVPACSAPVQNMLNILMLSGDDGEYKAFVDVAENCLECEESCVGLSTKHQFNLLCVVLAETGPRTGVTIGVGGDCSIEKKLTAYYPWCQLFAAEPGREAAKAFKDVGTVFTVAIGNPDTEYNVQLVPGTTNYKPMKTNTLGLLKFMEAMSW